MDRRKLLKALSIGTIPLSGCLSESKQSRSQRGASLPPNSSTTSNTDRSELPEYAPEYTYLDFQTGSENTVTDPEQNQPHEIGIWNATAETFGITVEIFEQPTESAVLSGTYRLPSDTDLSLTLLEPATYLVRIQPVTTDAKESLHIPRDRFDCNASTTHVGIRENGRINSTLLTTTRECD